MQVLGEMQKEMVIESIWEKETGLLRHTSAAENEQISTHIVLWKETTFEALNWTTLRHTFTKLLSQNTLSEINDP